MTELSEFIESAREKHKFIQSVVQQYFGNGLPTGVEGSRCRMISEKLKKLKTSDDHSAERLLKQIQSLRKEYENTLKNSELVKQEIDTEHELACALEKRKTKKSKCIATTLLIFGTVGATIVGQPHMGAAAGMLVRRRVSKACRTRTKKEEKRHESALQAHYSTEEKMIVTMEELGSIKFLIDKVVNEIDSLLRSTEVAINTGEVDYAMKTFKNKMETFLKQIDDLDTEAGKYIVNLEN